MRFISPLLQPSSDFQIKFKSPSESYTVPHVIKADSKILYVANKKINPIKWASS